MEKFRIVEITNRERSLFFPQKKILWIWWDLSFNGLSDKKEAENRIRKDKFTSERKIHPFSYSQNDKNIKFSHKEEKCLKRFCDRKSTTRDGLCQSCKDRDYGF